MPQDFIDSDAAMKVARENGITKPTATMAVSVVGAGEPPFWSVMDDAGLKPGDVMLDIDARTGALKSKTTQQ
jgi:hypothetical protein